jgi:hypothetical protein
VPIHALAGIEQQYRFAALIGIERGEKAVGAIGHKRYGMDAVRMELVSVAIDPAKPGNTLRA